MSNQIKFECVEEAEAWLVAWKRGRTRDLFEKFEIDFPWSLSLKRVISCFLLSFYSMEGGGRMMGKARGIKWIKSKSICYCFPRIFGFKSEKNSRLRSYLKKKNPNVMEQSTCFVYVQRVCSPSMEILILWWYLHAILFYQPTIYVFHCAIHLRLVVTSGRAAKRK